jgi:hypothetical protein
MSDRHPTTPDGRYFVVNGRLWRCSNPALDPIVRERLVNDLMQARRDIARARGNDSQIREARARVHRAKCALGERGAVWWLDGAPDYDRRLAQNTPYADWARSLAD